MIKTISGQLKARTAFMDADRYGRSDTSAIGRWFWEIDKEAEMDLKSNLSVPAASRSRSPQQA